MINKLTEDSTVNKNYAKHYAKHYDTDKGDLKAPRSVKHITNLRYKPKNLKVRTSSSPHSTGIFTADFDSQIFVLQLNPLPPPLSSYNPPSYTLKSSSPSPSPTLHMYRLTKSQTLTLLKSSSLLSLSPSCVKLKKVPKTVSRSSLRYMLREYSLNPVPNRAVREVKIKNNKEYCNYIVEFEGEEEARQFVRDNGELVIDSRRVFVELYK
ncbi:hypothetical protein TrVE_jg12440 [Triparma verrucosa]|uniref:RRM domain-containing protein n=1 Tax=Triparma verrucosa TaxID=1606542 RepID=A0A9W7F6I6_9STRA|nr:hypothetical protein TrVE_jg12440 [Triparma verrucosa]